MNQWITIAVLCVVFALLRALLHVIEKKQWEREQRQFLEDSFREGFRENRTGRIHFKRVYPTIKEEIDRIIEESKIFNKGN